LHFNFLPKKMFLNLSARMRWGPTVSMYVGRSLSVTLCHLRYISTCLEILFNMSWNTVQRVLKYISTCLNLHFNLYQTTFQTLLNYISTCLKMHFKMS
jgi:hypothetical protein